jgi:actin-related protein
MEIHTLLNREIISHSLLNFYRARSTKGNCILLSQPPIATREQSEKKAEILFEEFEVGSMALASSALLALMNAGEEAKE